MAHANKLRLVPRPEPTLEDGELIARVAGGDEAAFAELYKRHARAIAGVVYRLLGNDYQLEDIVQDTFVIALSSLTELRNTAALRRWLTTIAVRQVKRHLATRYRSRALGSELFAMVPRVSEPSSREDVHALYEALARLPDKQRIPWMLHHIEGETLPAVAEICDCSLTSVKRRIAAATKRLRRLDHAG